MRVLVLGAGVIGSVYGGHLRRVGHDVTFLARGQRLADLRAHGLILHEAPSGRRLVWPVPAVSVPTEGGPYDTVLVTVRFEQLAETLPLLAAMDEGADVVFFGNTAGRHRALTAAMGSRAIFGFPAAGGVRDGAVVRYVLVAAQKTMLGEPSGAKTERVERLRSVLVEAGFPTLVSAAIDDWLLGHVAFVVPLAYALAGAGTDARRLAADPRRVRLMVQATREAFAALRAGGPVEIPANLWALYRLPSPLVVRYWRRVLASPRGELWFAAHTRAAPQEMRALAGELTGAVRRARRPTPALDHLLSTPP